MNQHVMCVPISCAICFIENKVYIIVAIMQPSTSKDLKPLRKMRQMSGFNAWHAEYLRSTGLCY